MTKTAIAILISCLAAVSSSASADPWKDESGKGRGGDRRGHEHKEEFWDGNCKVERKHEKNGGYKEERKCKAPRHSSHSEYRDRPPAVQERVYYPAYEERIRQEPAVSIDVRVRP